MCSGGVNSPKFHSCANGNHSERGAAVELGLLPPLSVKSRGHTGGRWSEYCSPDNREVVREQAQRVRSGLRFVDFHFDQAAVFAAPSRERGSQHQEGGVRIMRLPMSVFDIAPTILYI